jgi:two-component system, OmpR family, phosphate regulon sensor histidine kinase PhoR
MLATVVVVAIVAMAVPPWLEPDVRASITVPTIIAGLVLAVGVAAALCWLCIRHLRRRLIAPLQEVEGGTRAIAEGAVSTRVADMPEAFADVRAVATAVNALADKVSADIADMHRLERVRSEFIANVSHELRTPIFSVQGYLETLLDGAVDDPNVSRQFLEKAYSNALRLNTLLHDLIDLSRIESGEMRMSFRYVNIVELLHDLLQTMEIRATQREVTLKLDNDPSADVMVYGDRERLSQVLTNLIDNAIKYNVPGGSVHVGARIKDAEVVVFVHDTGIGIPTDDVARIFERFYRVDKDRSRLVGGTGLGLAIVKHILEAHHAVVKVASEVGRGTQISFTLKGI